MKNSVEIFFEQEMSHGWHLPSRIQRKETKGNSYYTVLHRNAQYYVTCAHKETLVVVVVQSINENKPSFWSTVIFLCFKVI